MEEYRRLTKHNPIEAGDVLYTAVGSYGNSAIVPQGKEFVFQRHIAHLKPKISVLDPSYLSQMLETPPMRHQADRAARGIAQKTVTLSSLKDFQIPLPPIDEQRRIARILEKADALHRMRKRALDLLDSLTQSIFLEMFGSRDEWLSAGSLLKLEEFCRPKQWKTIPASLLHVSGFPVYGANGKIGFFDQYNHEKSTVLITCRGATCGEINVCEPKSYVTGNAMALDEPDEKLIDID